MNEIPASEFKLNDIHRQLCISGSPGLIQQIASLVSNLFVQRDTSFSIDQIKWINKDGWVIPDRFPDSVVKDGSGATGSNWTNNVFVYRDVGDGSRLTEVDIISHDRLEWELEKIIDTKDEIQQLFTYTHRIFCMQVTDLILYHNFVLFKAGKWFVTIEKNTEGILIQRSLTRSGVQDFAFGKKRNTPITLQKKEIARGRVIDLIDWLYRTREQLRTYHVLDDNCQLFSYRVNDYLTRWENEIYLYRDVGFGQTHNRCIRLANDEMLNDFKKVIKVEELILEYKIYKQNQPSSRLGNQRDHYFVLFKSEENWFWTIEMNNKYTILQRSKSESGVIEYVQGTARENPRLYKKYHGQSLGNKKLEHLIKYLYAEQLKTAVQFRDNKNFALHVCLFFITECLTKKKSYQIIHDTFEI